MANRFLDRNMGQIIASTNEAISTIMSLRKLRWDYAIDKAKMNYSLNREQDNRNWQMNLEMFKEQKADERLNQQMNYNKIQSLNKAKAMVEKQATDIQSTYGHIPQVEEAKNAAMQASTPEEVFKLFNVEGLTRNIIASVYKSRTSQPSMVNVGFIKKAFSGLTLPPTMQRSLSSLSDDQMVPTPTANAWFKAVFSYNNIGTRSTLKTLDTNNVYKTINMLEAYEKANEPSFIKKGIEGVGLHEYKTPEYDQAHALRISLSNALQQYTDAVSKEDTQTQEKARATLVQLLNVGNSFLSGAYEPKPASTPKPGGAGGSYNVPAPVNPNTGSTGGGRDPFKTANEIWEKMKQQSGKGPNG